MTNDTNLTNIEAMAQAKAIAKSAAYGAISYEEAKRQAQPLLDQVNAAGREIAKRHKKTYRPITFLGLGR